MSKYIIYGLLDPITKEIRYIGKSSSGLLRPRRHLTEKSYTTETNHKAHWIKSLMIRGITPEIVIIKVCNNANDLIQLEIITIKEYRDAGARLTNLTDGGEGSLGWVPSEETRQNMIEGRARYLSTLTEPLIAPNKKEHVFVNEVECKVCVDCNELKCINEFGIASSNWDRLKKNCKSCNAKRTAEWRLTKPPRKKLTDEELAQSYKDRTVTMTNSIKNRYANDPSYKAKISARNSKAIEGTNISTGEKIYFNSAIEAKKTGFNNTNIWKAIRNNKSYKGYMWKYV